MFGPHVTNLGDDERRFTDRHVAYYERRARGGCGTIVVEGASVHASDWPYERAPLAQSATDGWASIVEACAVHGTLVIASLDHAGGQGSSAFHQRELWAPSHLPEVNTREVPKSMEPEDIEAVVTGFAAAATSAVNAGCDGVEVNAGQHSLVRQFLSGLTNQRGDEWGSDRLRFATDVLQAVRRASPGVVLGLRLSCDELAPWAGITPEMAPDLAAALTAHGVDYLVVVRGSIFSTYATRSDFHTPPGHNRELTRAVARAIAVPVFLQGSIVDVTMAEQSVGGDDPCCAGVEMTRAQIADPDVVGLLASGAIEQIRPCILCNQNCQVRDNRNPLVSCVAEPSAGHETEDPDWYAPADRPRAVHVIGAGPAGLEAARVAARRGHSVTVYEQAGVAGGLAAVSGPGRPLVAWLVAEVERLGVAMRLNDAVTDIDGLGGNRGDVIECTGSIPGRPAVEVEDGAQLLDIVEVVSGTVPLPDDGDVVVLDPIGGPIAVALAETLGRRAILVTQDHIAGNHLSLTGDLAPANTRLAQAGVRIERRTIPRIVAVDGVTVSDRFTGERRTIPCVAAVDCGFRLPAPPLDGVSNRAGDCVAPRTLYEAILEGRRAALAL
ncbi:MAG: mycofactocin system FadH/OYE family oxidoreductase 1 [Actinomycetota bacterium]|nr:mycofactocin system FadH/OYE family oxidoreductase 1 [Actinomycetota bacterium]